MFRLKYTQNFLVSNNLVKNIIALSNINKNDTVYEIGCGKGIITKQLSLKCKNVIGIELDHNLYNNLKLNFPSNSNIKIMENDFLNINLPKNYPYKVFSNIPFNITTKIIQKLTNINDCPSDSYLIVQKEVALKMIGKYGLNMQQLLTKPFFDFKIIYKFKRFDFKPVPSVDVVLLHISLKKDCLIDKRYYNQYKKFINYIFLNKNYNIKTAFQGLLSYEQIKRLGRQNHFNINDNITSIDINGWISIFMFYMSLNRNKIKR